MPIIIEGYVTVSAAKLREHEGHALAVDTASGRVELTCPTCHDTRKPLVIEAEPEERDDLPCGCRTKADHDEGLALQVKYGKGIPKSACVGCVLGDDGPSVHSCVIHDRRYWA